MSNKYKHINQNMSAETRPKIVSLEWLMDCMELGEVVPAEKYQITI